MMKLFAAMAAEGTQVRPSTYNKERDVQNRVRFVNDEVEDLDPAVLEKIRKQ